MKLVELSYFLVRRNGQAFEVVFVTCTGSGTHESVKCSVGDLATANFLAQRAAVRVGIPVRRGKGCRK